MLEVVVPAGPDARARVCFTERSDGDFAEVLPPTWTWLDQVHGATVIHVRGPGDRAGSAADAAVTDVLRAPLAVRTADCVPVVLVGAGVVAAVHAGWRGLVAGVLEAAVAATGASTATLRGLIGPCIRPADYEFGADDLEEVTSVFGPSVRSVTRTGGPALDLAGCVAVSLGRLGVPVEDPGHDTADATRWFSHRLRRETSRQATVVTLEPT